MSSRPERAVKLPIVNDDDLRARIGRRNPTALHLMLYVRKRAMLKGRLEIEIANWQVCEDLKIDRRQLQRAKAFLREAGFAIETPVARHRGRDGQSGNVQTVYVLDRRRLRGRLELVDEHAEALGTEDRPGAVPEPATTREEKQPSPEERLRLALQEKVDRAAARDGPHGAAELSTTSTGEPAPQPPGGVSVLGPAPRSEPPGLPRASELEPEVTQLRRWLTVARGSALTGQRATALLDRAEAQVAREPGANAFRVHLARRALELELGAGQTSLDDDAGGPSP